MTNSKVTPFGKTRIEHLESSLKWLDSRRERLHHEECAYHAPSALCNCGLHKCLTDVRAALESMNSDIAQPEQPFGWLVTWKGKFSEPTFYKGAEKPNALDDDWNEHPVSIEPLWAYATPQPVPIAQAEPLSDGEIAKVVNELRDVALQFHSTQQLRERIAQVVVPLLQNKGGAI